MPTIEAQARFRNPLPPPDCARTGQGCFGQASIRVGSARKSPGPFGVVAFPPKLHKGMLTLNMVPPPFTRKKGASRRCQQIIQKWEQQQILFKRGGSFRVTEQPIPAIPSSLTGHPATQQIHMGPLTLNFVPQGHGGGYDYECGYSYDYECRHSYDYERAAATTNVWLKFSNVPFSWITWKL